MEITEDWELTDSSRPIGVGVEAGAERNKPAAVSHEFPLPRVEDFPPEVQPKIKSRIQAVAETESRIGGRIKFYGEVSAFAETIDEKIKLMQAEIPDETLVDREFTEMRGRISREIRILVTARDKLIRNQDASLILEMENDPTYKEKVEEYGTPRSRLKRLRQLVKRWRLGARYEVERQEFIDSQWHYFLQRRGDLMEYPNAYGVRQEEINHLPNPADMTDPTKLEEFKQQEDSGLDEARKVIFRAGLSRRVGKLLTGWLAGDWTNSIDLSSKWETSRVGLEDLTGQLNFELWKTDNFFDSFQRMRNYILEKKESLGRAVLWEIGKEGSRVRDLFVDSALSFQEASYFSGIPIPDHKLSPLVYCSASSQEFSAIGRLAKTADDFYRRLPTDGENGFVNYFQRVRDGLESLARLNREFVNSRDLFWHVAPMDTIINDILIPGKLLSRAKQMELKGEATYNSGGLKARRLPDGKYLVIKNADGAEKQFTVSGEDELFEVSGNRGKTWGSEYHELCFTRDQPYMYQRGVALCLSVASVAAKSRFTEADGWHIFDKNFTGERGSPGVEIDLAAEPHLVVLIEEVREKEFREKLMAAIGKEGKVLGGKVDVDEWIGDHVVVVNRLTSQDEIQRAKDVFFAKNQVSVKEGWFMPTGVATPGSYGIYGNKPLVEYKSL
jgi:hypothetical protein